MKTLSRKTTCCVAGLCFVLIYMLGQPLCAGQEMFVYFGTYTKTSSKGIYVSRFDAFNEKISEPELAAETTNPSFLALHPDGRFLYAVGEMNGFDGRPEGAVKAYSIHTANGHLALLNQQSSGGKGPCHISTDHHGKVVLVANYGGGNIAAFPIDKNGHLSKSTAFVQHVGSSVHPQRQKEPHAHSINVDPSNRFAVAADLGIDKLMIYQLNTASGTLTSNDPSFSELHPGAGPRHFSFHPHGRFAYAINELDCTVTAFAFNRKKGLLKPIQKISTLPEGENLHPGYSTAEVLVHPSGKFLYGSNRGHDSIVVFAINQKNGRLALVENKPTQGKTPRNFGIEPTGKFLLAANQNSDTVVVFRINPDTGRLTPTGQVLSVPMPACVRFLPIKK